MQQPPVDITAMLQEREKQIKMGRQSNMYIGRDNIFKDKNYNTQKVGSSNDVSFEQQQNQLVNQNSSANLNNKNAVDQKELKSNLRAHHFQLGYRQNDGQSESEKEKQYQSELVNQYMSVGRALDSHRNQMKELMHKNKDSSIVLGNEIQRNASHNIDKKRYSTSQFVSNGLAQMSQSAYALDNQIQSAIRGDSQLNKTYDTRMIAELKEANSKIQGLHPNKQSSIMLGNLEQSPTNQWESTNKQIQNQALDFKYNPIGKYEKTEQYRKTQFQIAHDQILMQRDFDRERDKIANKKPQEILTQGERDAIVNEMKSNDNFIPTQSTQNQTLKRDVSPPRHELQANFENRNLVKNVQLGDASQPQIPQDSVYLNYHNSQTGKVDSKLIAENKEKTKIYKDRILNTQINLGDDVDTKPKNTVVREDYTKYDDIDKSFEAALKKKEENKQIVEKQTINVFQHQGYENMIIGKQNQSVDKYNVKRDDNKDLFHNLKKSNIHLGSEAIVKNSQNRQTYASMDTKQNVNQYIEKKKEFDKIQQNSRQGQVFQSTMDKSYQSGSAYKDQYIWKKPKYDI
ncbi:UNKNOWN [Stylonychia lemnae]|uniref:Uncharacterized protein n=1 Tax=Stylonychia lemnae TaxID=5949 RepID=A0A078AC75_STYLE|nr:UNKNOWN [Stylonychia lemnae]|eukprot:CDW79207.1 UNKNOWN [Stylonychia lemnae]